MKMVLWDISEAGQMEAHKWEPSTANTGHHWMIAQAESVDHGLALDGFVNGHVP